MLLLQPDEVDTSVPIHPVDLAGPQYRERLQRSPSFELRYEVRVGVELVRIGRDWDGPAWCLQLVIGRLTEQGFRQDYIVELVQCNLAVFPYGNQALKRWRDLWETGQPSVSLAELTLNFHRSLGTMMVKFSFAKEGLPTCSLVLRGDFPMWEVHGPLPPVAKVDDLFYMRSAVDD